MEPPGLCQISDEGVAIYVEEGGVEVLAFSFGSQLQMDLNIDRYFHLGEALVPLPHLCDDCFYRGLLLLVQL